MFRRYTHPLHKETSAKPSKIEHTIVLFRNAYVQEKKNNSTIKLHETRSRPTRRKYKIEPQTKSARDSVSSPITRGLDEHPDSRVARGDECEIERLLFGLFSPARPILRLVSICARDARRVARSDRPTEGSRVARDSSIIARARRPIVPDR